SFVVSCSDPPATALYTLSLHDALPISAAADREGGGADRTGSQPAAGAVPADAEAFERDVGTLWLLAFGCGAWGGRGRATSGSSRSEEHTSELQSRVELVCRLLLEKKNR